MIVVEQSARRMLCTYLKNGWAAFVYKPDKDGDWKCVKNGKLSDVLPVYLEQVK